MMFSLIFVVIGVLSLILIVYLAKGHHSAGGNLDELASKLKFIDVNAFRNLIDEGEEEFLRVRLPRHEFRSIQRERKLAAIEYIWCAAQNAAMLIRLGEAAKQDPDPAVSAAADKVVENALRLRLYAFQVVPRLYLSMVLPGASLAPYFVADTYDKITRQAVMLGCLQHSTREMSRAL
jgi:hypothetical protein